jgi:hypothetical protein
MENIFLVSSMGRSLVEPMVLLFGTPVVTTLFLGAPFRGYVIQS